MKLWSHLCEIIQNREEELIVDIILNLIAKIVYKYGKEGAGMPSYRGTYELEVPIELINSEYAHKINSDGS